MKPQAWPVESGALIAKPPILRVWTVFEYLEHHNFSKIHHIAAFNKRELFRYLTDQGIRLGWIELNHWLVCEDCGLVGGHPTHIHIDWDAITHTLLVNHG